MAKVTWKPGTMEYPVPPVMVSCGTMEKSNIITVAWTGIISSEPPMTYVSIRPSRYSHELIKESGEFVINLTTLPIVSATDFCGVKSGKDVDKFQELNLTKGVCSKVSAPQIMESPISLECKVVSTVNYGSHDMFVAEILAVNVDEQFIDKSGKLMVEKTGLIAYAHNNYFTLGRNVGFFGFSVCKSDKMAKEKMKNVVVEIKESKALQIEATDKFAKKDWGNKSSDKSKKFDGKSKFEKSKKSDSERSGRSFDRKPREDGERGGRSFDRKPREGGERGGRSFDRKPREDGERGGRSFERKPREDGERGGRSFDRKPREGGERGGRSFDRKPREGGERGGRSFDRKPREGGERGGRSFDRKPREGGERGGRGSERKPREGGERGGRGSERSSENNRSFNSRPRKTFK